MKIAIVHDWFNDIGGAEKVVREMLVCYPEAELFALIDFFDSEKRTNFLNGKSVTTSFLQHIPFAKKLYRLFFPLFPKAIEGLNLSTFDIIISSSSSVAKGITKTKKQLHICYCHSPARYAWDLKQDYVNTLSNPLSKKVLNYFLEKLKTWDLSRNQNVDYFIANSHNVKDRIKHNYNREANVIYPPVSIHNFEYTAHKENFYLTVSRLVAYKKTEQIIRAFAKFPHLKLKVAGEGPNAYKLKEIATPNIEFMGFIPSLDLSKNIKQAKAFIANANEDFGITVVEAQASGTPVIVPYLGGYKETVTTKTGLFFNSQSVEDIEKAIQLFETNNTTYHESDFKNAVKPFAKERFAKEFKEFVEETKLIFFK